MKVKVFRPHLDDVERLSYGKGAKKQRGTGSRSVCHRLNKNERKLYDMAKKSGYLSMRGTGYRKERSGSPLWNIFRQRCDALEEICIVVEKRHDKVDGLDVVVIDFSTLRVWNDRMFVERILDKVLKVNYPDLYLDVMKHYEKEQDDNSSSSHTAEPDSYKRSLSKTCVNAPIDREAVKMKPIWGVNERLVTVSCATDVAKAVALDVLKESQKFDYSQAYQIDNVIGDEEEGDDGNFEKKPEGCCTNDIERIEGTRTTMVEPILIPENNVTLRVEDDDESSIDWNDI